MQHTYAMVHHSMIYKAEIHVSVTYSVGYYISTFRASTALSVMQNCGHHWSNTKCIVQGSTPSSSADWLERVLFLKVRGFPVVFDMSSISLCMEVAFLKAVYRSQCLKVVMRCQRTVFVVRLTKHLGNQTRMTEGQRSTCLLCQHDFGLL